MQLKLKQAKLLRWGAAIASSHSRDAVGLPAAGATISRSPSTAAKGCAKLELSYKKQQIQIHNATFTTVRQGETLICFLSQIIHSSFSTSRLLTSNGKTVEEGAFLTHLIMLKDIKKHLQLVKEAGGFPSVSRRTRCEGLETTQLWQEWACNDTYRNSYIKKVAAISR